MAGTLWLVPLRGSRAHARCECPAWTQGPSHLLSGSFEGLGGPHPPAAPPCPTSSWESARQGVALAVRAPPFCVKGTHPPQPRNPHSRQWGLPGEGLFSPWKRLGPSLYHDLVTPGSRPAPGGHGGGPQVVRPTPSHEVSGTLSQRGCPSHTFSGHCLVGRKGCSPGFARVLSLGAAPGPVTDARLYLPRAVGLTPVPVLQTNLFTPAPSSSFLLQGWVSARSLQQRRVWLELGPWSMTLSPPYQPQGQ